MRFRRCRSCSPFVRLAAACGAAYFAAGCGGATFFASGFGADDDGGASATATAGGDAGPSATDGGPATDDRLLPLETGRTWTYERSVLDPAGPLSECSRPLEGSVAGRVTVEQEPGKTGFDYHPSCLASFSVYMFMDGDDIRGYPSNDPSNPPFQYARPPVEDGASWASQRDGVTFTWRDAGSVTVPAGTFDRCWRRIPSDSDGYIVLCRGVGLILSYVPGDNYVLELVKKNF